MPLTLANRFGLAIVVFLGSPAAVAEETPKCTPHGPLRTFVAPNEEDPTLARRTLDQILSELARRTAACPASEGEPIELEVRWRPGDHVFVRFTMRTTSRELSVERDVDLDRVPPDEIPLAVAIIADEMLAEMLDRSPVAEAMPSGAIVKSPLPHVARQPHEPSTSPHFRFGLRAAHQEITSGLGLTGFDVEAAWLVTANFQLAARAGLRAVSSLSQAQSAHHGFDVSALALVGTNAFAIRGIAALMALDVLGLESTARASPALGAYVWQKVDKRFVLSLDGRVGGILGDPAEFSALSGACVSISVGFATEW